MAFCSLNEPSNGFNQSSLSFSAKLQLAERISQLEMAATLMDKVEALSAAAMFDGLDSLDAHQRHFYWATVNELSESANEQLQATLAVLHQLSLK